jgi:hypothetical protein
MTKLINALDIPEHAIEFADKMQWEHPRGGWRIYRTVGAS